MLVLHLVFANLRRLIPVWFMLELVFLLANKGNYDILFIVYGVVTDSTGIMRLILRLIGRCKNAS